MLRICCFFFFFHDPATTEIYTLSLHDALPISIFVTKDAAFTPPSEPAALTKFRRDRKSTRLNSSHRCISYAVFCLKKKRINYDENKAIAEVINDGTLREKRTNEQSREHLESTR